MTNSIVLTKGTEILTSWNTKLFFQSSRYRLKQKIKIPKYKLAYKNLYHEMCMSFQSSNKKYILPKFLAAKIPTLDIHYDS